MWRKVVVPAQLILPCFPLGHIPEAEFPPSLAASDLQGRSCPPALRCDGGSEPQFPPVPGPPQPTAPPHPPTHCSLSSLCFSITMQKRHVVTLLCPAAPFYFQDLLFCHQRKSFRTTSSSSQFFQHCSTDTSLLRLPLSLSLWALLWDHSFIGLSLGE